MSLTFEEMMNEDLSNVELAPPKVAPGTYLATIASVSKEVNENNGKERISVQVTLDEAASSVATDGKVVPIAVGRKLFGSINVPGDDASEGAISAFKRNLKELKVAATGVETGGFGSDLSVYNGRAIKVKVSYDTDKNDSTKQYLRLNYLPR